MPDDRAGARAQRGLDCTVINRCCPVV
jgi:hypothetical protein